MPNTNCLEGFRCPRCGSDHAFDIVMTAWFRLCDNGTDGCGDTEWDETSACRCPACGLSGIVRDFRAE